MRSHYEAREVALGPYDIETFPSFTTASPKEEEERMIFFMGQWVHAFMRRTWGACKLSSGENVLNEKKVILLFDTLLLPLSHQGIAWSCVPTELTKINGLPPKDWSILPMLVERIFKDWCISANRINKRKRDWWGNEDIDSDFDEDLLLSMN